MWSGFHDWILDIDTDGRVEMWSEFEFCGVELLGHDVNDWNNQLSLVADVCLRHIIGRSFDLFLIPS